MGIYDEEEDGLACTMEMLEACAKGNEDAIKGAVLEQACKFEAFYDDGRCKMTFGIR